MNREPRVRAHSCSICGAEHRNSRTHVAGMTKADHERGAVDWQGKWRTRGKSQSGRTSDYQSRPARNRATDSARRESWVGRMVTMPNKTRWKVAKHINGSLYEITKPKVGRGNWSRYASHPTHDSEWRWWDDERPEAEHQSMDEAIEDLIQQEDEAATMAPPTEDSDTLRLELLGARMEWEDGHLFVVFKGGPSYFSGRLDKYVPSEFNPLDLIKKPEDD